jgi:hypothetical protein
VVGWAFSTRFVKWIIACVLSWSSKYINTNRKSRRKRFVLARIGFNARGKMLCYLCLAWTSWLRSIEEPIMSQSISWQIHDFVASSIVRLCNCCCQNLRWSIQTTECSTSTSPVINVRNNIINVGVHQIGYKVWYSQMSLSVRWLRNRRRCYLLSLWGIDVGYGVEVCANRRCTVNDSVASRQSIELTCRYRVYGFNRSLVGVCRTGSVA